MPAGRPRGAPNKKTAAEEQLQSLREQLQRALGDAETLQKQTKRGDSYVSEMKLATVRVVTLRREISSVENSALEPLRAENKKLKQEIASLKAEIETLKQRPAEPIAPEVKTMNAAAEKLFKEMGTLGKKIEPESPVLDLGVVVKPNPSTLPSVSGAPQPVRLTPPRVIEDVPQLPDVLAQPRPVITPAETEKKAIASMGSQFQNTEANVERILREAKEAAEKLTRK